MRAVRRGAILGAKFGTEWLPEEMGLDCVA